MPSAQRASALRLAFARQALDAGLTVWPTPHILPWDTWLKVALTEASGSGAAPVLKVLNTAQERHLWQQALRLVGESYAPHASAVAKSAALLGEWELPLAQLAGGYEAAVLSQARNCFDALCRERSCIAASQALPAQLAALAPIELLFAGFERLSPRQRRVASLFEAQGAAAQLAEGAVPIAVIEARSAADWRAEAAAAAHWCAQQLGADPRRRLLVVALHRDVDPGVLGACFEEVLQPQTWYAHGSAPDRQVFAMEGGEALDRSAAIADALAVLRLAQEPLEFQDVSLVLLSRYLHPGPAGRATELELWIRDLNSARLPWSDLRQALFTVPAVLQETAAQFVAAVTQLRELCAPSARRSARDWAEQIAAVLERFGYPGPAALSSRDVQVLRRWQELLEELASIDVVSGPLSTRELLFKLAELAAAASHQAATGDVAVTLTLRREDPLIRYDGIWVMGLDDQTWPEPPRPDAFVPLELQRRVGLPHASVRSRLAEARFLTQRWRAATPLLVLSHSRSDADLPLHPSVVFNELGLQPLPLPGIPMPLLATGQAIASDADAQMPPLQAAAEGLWLRAGTSVPELQGACAFRAQAQLRLGATQLGAPGFGIDARHRGQLLHSALEAAWRELRGSERLRSAAADEIGTLIAAATQHAAADLARKVKLPLPARTMQREVARTRRVLKEALQLELLREDFVVEELEATRQLTVDSAQLRLRIDRIDRLADGSVAVIDYKSSASGRFDLLSSRAQPMQLLAYLRALEAPVSALALLALTPGKPAFRAVTDHRERLASSRNSELQDWALLLPQWRALVDATVRSHLAGDATVDPAPHACQHCHLATLCRVSAEVLAQGGGDGDDD